MALKKCDFCKKIEVPKGGQCSNCGFIDGIQRMPTDSEFKRARQINKENNYPLYKDLDMLLMDAEE